ncbi:hypothetical protein F383_29641 [Gossypium arboreum]|uniref:Uncharacterized protein n=1 Tax=Gossypium arboreum TaxID=29729 RepID=A0A0B0PFJ6_GOSAR|nr:hypothetical protein F383_29641 [Gossypium arboreum]
MPKHSVKYHRTTIDGQYALVLLCKGEKQHYPARFFDSNYSN